MTKIINTAKLLPTFEELFNFKVIKSMKLRPEALKLSEKIGSGENLYIFLGSSGAGRDTIMDECLAQLTNGERLRRTTTREPREYVKDQKRMLFVLEEDFKGHFEKGEIISAGRYKANQKLYGMGRKELLKLKNKKKRGFIEANFNGLALKAMFPQSKLVVVLPPTADVLKDRIFSRDASITESRKRFQTSVSEIRAVLDNLKGMREQKIIEMVIINEEAPQMIGKRVVQAIRANKKIIDDYSQLKKTLKQNI